VRNSGFCLVSQLVIDGLGHPLPLTVGVAGSDMRGGGANGGARLSLLRHKRNWEVL